MKLRLRLHIQITPPLSAGDLGDLLLLRDEGIDVVAYGERRISVPAHEMRAEKWLRGRNYQTSHITPKDERILPRVPFLRRATD